MPYFQEKRATERVILPTNKEYWVDVYANLTWREDKVIAETQVKGEKLTLDTALMMLIADWNLTDESGNKAPIDQEHVDRLEHDDIEAIIGVVYGIIFEDKETKKASSRQSRKA